MESITSRFFATTDARSENFVLPLLPVWWSRPYEYTWAGEFVAPEDTVLDAACGIEHPFKFFLLDHAREVHACDREAGILSGKTIRESLCDTYGESIAGGLPERYLRDIRFRQASITAMPYGEKMFDKVFCLSVLEHLTDRFNRYPWLPRRGPLNYFLKKDIHASLSEFSRILTDDGLIILTFDYPDINLGYLAEVISSLGLSFAAETRFDLPRNAVYSESLHLYCFRAVLKKIP